MSTEWKEAQNLHGQEMLWRYYGLSTIRGTLVAFPSPAPSPRRFAHQPDVQACLRGAHRARLRRGATERWNLTSVSDFPTVLSHGWVRRYTGVCGPILASGAHEGKQKIVYYDGHVEYLNFLKEKWRYSSKTRATPSAPQTPKPGQPPSCEIAKKPAGKAPNVGSDSGTAGRSCARSRPPVPRPVRPAANPVLKRRLEYTTGTPANPTPDLANGKRAREQPGKEPRRESGGGSQRRVKDDLVKGISGQNPNPGALKAGVIQHARDRSLVSPATKSRTNRAQDTLDVPSGTKTVAKLQHKPLAVHATHNAKAPQQDRNVAERSPTAVVSDGLAADQQKPSQGNSLSANDTTKQGVGHDASLSPANSTRWKADAIRAIGELATLWLLRNGYRPGPNSSCESESRETPWWCNSTSVDCLRGVADTLRRFSSVEAVLRFVSCTVQDRTLDVQWISSSLSDTQDSNPLESARKNYFFWEPPPDDEEWEREVLIMREIHRRMAFALRGMENTTYSGIRFGIQVSLKASYARAETS